jgi:hypothetical protein
MKEKIYCKECGAENYIKFYNAYNENWIIIDGWEVGGTQCWKCKVLISQKRLKKYTNLTCVN